MNYVHSIMDISNPSVLFLWALVFGFMTTALVIAKRHKDDDDDDDNGTGYCT